MMGAGLQRYLAPFGGAFLCYHARMDGKDIWRAAKLLIAQYGNDAATHAAMRADELLTAGDDQGARVWKRVVKAIGDLTAVGPDEMAH
jgi:hypothetical protein